MANQRYTSFMVKDILKKEYKRKRHRFSSEDLIKLEFAFTMNRYLTSNEKQELASELQVSTEQIAVWMQNRRKKWRKDEDISKEEVERLREEKRKRENRQPCIWRQRMYATQYRRVLTDEGLILQPNIGNE